VAQESVLVIGVQYYSDYGEQAWYRLLYNDIAADSHGKITELVAALRFEVTR
jgi:hypothetical protein